MKLVLLTGMSAAGKSLALKSLESCGYETLDNIPPAFLEAIAGSTSQSRSVAVGTDVCSDRFSVSAFMGAIEPLRKSPAIDFKLVFLDADDEVLSRRLQETRGSHPLLPDRKIADGIKHERELIGALRDAADVVIDTSEHEGMDFRKLIASHFTQEPKKRSIAVTSFSFKRGVPREADFLFDVRFLKNPHYMADLKALTGLDGKVGEYIKGDADYQAFFERMTGFLSLVLPRHMQREATRHYITISLGCTGGRHRSVFVAEQLGEFMKKQGYDVTLRHRDVL